ncbi:MAG: hypothetical protein LKK13_03800 [Bacilli bacterium]|jgi:hypothetical protein|nr:hypothetical protein [Bacilli bacterium]
MTISLIIATIGAICASQVPASQNIGSASYFNNNQTDFVTPSLVRSTGEVPNLSSSQTYSTALNTQLGSVSLDGHTHVESALNITPSLASKNDDYTVSVSSYLPPVTVPNSTMLPCGCFRFDAFSLANVVITLSSNVSSKPFMMYLEGFRTHPYYQGQKATTPFDICVDENSTLSKRFERQLFADSYCIKIVGTSTEGYDASNVFALTVSAQYLPSPDVKISDLRYCKGAKAALVAADYLPGGIQPFSTIKEEELGFGRPDAALNLQQDPFPRLMNEFADNGDIPFATLYVWDPDVLSSVRTIIYSLYSSLNDNTDITGEQELEVQIKKNGQIVDDVFDAVSGVGNIVISIVSPEFNVITDVVLPIAEKSFDKLIDVVVAYVTPHMTLSKANLLIALARIWQACDDLLKIPGATEFASLKLPLTYRFSEKMIHLIPHYYVSFGGLINLAALANNDIVTTEDDIPCSFQASLCNHHVYCFTDDDAFPLASFDTLSQNKTDINSFGAPSIINQGVPFNIEIEHVGQYIWASFTAPATSVYTIACNATAYHSETVASCPDFDVFRDVVPGHSENGLVFTHHLSSPLRGGDGVPSAIYVGYFDIKLAQGETVYLRVSGHNWGDLPYVPSIVISPFVPSASRPTPYNHHHHYIYGCQYNSPTSHKKLCWCGAYELEPHVFDGSPWISHGHTYCHCSICNHDIDIGAGGGGFVQC